jgi:hypothetical protein
VEFPGGAGAGDGRPRRAGLPDKQAYQSAEAARCWLALPNDPDRPSAPVGAIGFDPPHCFTPHHRVGDLCCDQIYVAL